MSLTHRLIDAYRTLSAPLRKAQLSRFQQGNSVPICVLFYHRVADHDLNPWTITNAGFAEQLDWLSENFDLLSMDQVVDRIDAGHSDRPAVAITFDDGYADNMDFAIPSMIQRQIPLTYYVASRFVTDQKFFPHDLELDQKLFPNSVRDLKQMAKQGVTIGSHSRNHVDFGKLSDHATIVDEMVGCRRELENILECPVKHFAFPFGQRCNITTQAINVAREAGFRSICGAYGGYNFMDQNSFFIQRIHGDPSLARIKNWTTLDPRKLSIQPEAQWLSDLPEEKERGSEKENSSGRAHKSFVAV